MRKTAREPPDIEFCDCSFRGHCTGRACYDNDRNSIMINGNSAQNFNVVLDLISHETAHWTLEMFLTRWEINRMLLKTPEKSREYNKFLPEKIANEIEKMIRMRRYAANKKRKD